MLRHMLHCVFTNTSHTPRIYAGLYSLTLTTEGMYPTCTSHVHAQAAYAHGKHTEVAREHKPTTSMAAPEKQGDKTLSATTHLMANPWAAWLQAQGLSLQLPLFLAPGTAPLAQRC